MAFFVVFVMVFVDSKSPASAEQSGHRKRVKSRRLQGPQNILRKCKQAILQFRTSAENDLAPFGEVECAANRIICLAEDLARIYDFDICLITNYRPGSTKIDNPDTQILNPAIGLSAKRVFEATALSSHATSVTLQRLWPHGEALLRMAVSLCQVRHTDRLIVRSSSRFPLTVSHLDSLSRRPRRASDADPTNRTPVAADAVYETSGRNAIVQPAPTPERRPKTEISDSFVAAGQHASYIASSQSFELAASSPKAIVKPIQTSLTDESLKQTTPGQLASDATPAPLRPTEVRVVSTGKVPYIRPRDDVTASRVESDFGHIWSNMADAALGPADGSVVLQILTPAETGYRGVAPSPSLTRGFLTIARESVALTDETSSTFSLPMQECVPRPATHLSRLDVPSAYASTFEVAPGCVEDLLVRGLIDEIELSKYIGDIMQKVVPKWTNATTSFKDISPPLDDELNRGKPLYLKASKNIRNAPCRRALCLIREFSTGPRDVIYHVESGNHVLIFNPAGAGKTLLLESIGSRNSPLVRYNAFRKSGFLDIKGKRYEGDLNSLIARLQDDALENPAVLIDECTFMTPDLLSKLDVFCQIVMVGDPCQLGAPLAAELVHDFMSRIGAYIKKDGKVFRIRNPSLFSLMNYIGYEGRFSAVYAQRELEEMTFQIVSCKQHLLARAIAIVLACMSHTQNRKSVIFATENLTLRNLVNSLIRHDRDILEKVDGRMEFRLLSGLQGTQADVLVFDPSEVDLFITDPYTSAVYLTMLLGRATSTISLIVPDREIATSQTDLQPFSMMVYGCCEYQPPS